MPRFLFKVKLVGEGANVEDAWENAVEAFGLDPGSVDELPDDVKILEDDDLGATPLSDDEVEEDLYVKNSGSYCPNCQSTELEGIGEINADGDWMSSEIKCNNCGARWTDIYTLSGYDNLEVPESPVLEPQSPTNQ